MAHTKGRWILRSVAVWMLIGAVVSIGVAWAIALWECSRYGTLRNRLYDSLHMKMYTGPWPTHPPKDWSLETAPSVFEAIGIGARMREWVSMWPLPTGPLPPVGMQGNVYRTRRLDVGFPVRCLATETWIVRSNGLSLPAVVDMGWWRGGLALDRPLSTGAARWVIPMLPDGPALLLNAVCWGGVLWAVSGGYRRWRGAWRCERGRCVQCGYDRSGLTDGSACPECSAAPTSPL